VFDLFQLVVFSALGYILIKLGCEPAPLILGLVLGPMMEEHLRRALLISLGDPSVFVTSPLSAAFLLAALALLASIAVPLVRAKRDEALQE
jgi:putative tricarboxylic transport membrane protein